MEGPLVGLVRQRLRAALEEIARIASSEFPNDATRDALACIREFFLEHEGMLDRVESPDTAEVVCQNALKHLTLYLPFLGFILRSTNVRNAFELHAPLTRLCRALIAPDARLVISSEWEYSPLMMMEAKPLDDFVFIGLPAHESGNPFILPLAGHELGHVAWHREARYLWRSSFESDLERRIVTSLSGQLPRFRELYPEFKDPTADKLANDWVFKQTWAQAFEWAKKQAEEYFCDFFGLRLFGEAYLHAFSYLLAPSMPGIGEERPVHYPNFLRRIRAQEQAAATYGITVPAGYAAAFSDLPEISEVEAHKSFLVGLADEAADHLVPELIAHADSLLAAPALLPWKIRNPDAGKSRPSGPPAPEEIPNPAVTEQLTRIQADFFALAPAAQSGGLPLLLNAAWRVLLSAQNLAGLGPEAKAPVLRELLLKSIEVLEFETRIAPIHAPQG